MLLPTNNSDSNDETTARPCPGTKSRKCIRHLAAGDGSDIDETPIKKQKRTSRGEEDNGEDQGGLGSDVYAE